MVWFTLDTKQPMSSAGLTCHCYVPHVELHPFLLVFELRRCGDVLERMLMTRLDEAEWPRLTINQVLMFAHLEPDGVTAAELARRMEMSRQSMQKNLDRLRELELVTLRPHPHDRRSSLVSVTGTGERFSRRVAEILDGFERRLEAALGTGVVNEVRSMLTADLGQILRIDQNASGR